MQPVQVPPKDLPRHGSPSPRVSVTSGSPRLNGFAFGSLGLNAANSSSLAGTPTNMSPHVSCRAINVHGMTTQSSRAAGALDDHHQRSNSGVDLASLAELSGKGSSRGRSHSIGSDDGRDAFELDSGKGTLVGTGTWSIDKTTHVAQSPNDDSSEDDDEGKASPMEPSRASSPVNASGNSAETERTASKKEGRLLIVANRLPLSMKVTKKPATDGSGKEVNEMTFSSSSGGLVSALGGCEMESRWIGWPGAEVKRAADRASVRTKLDEMNCVPVFLPQKVCEGFYSGFSNNILWPLFHYLPLPVESITTADKEFQAYQTANQAFAEVVMKTYQDGDVVWIHDYHLMLLPRLLRKRFPNIKIGFFFHTPFPAFEIYRGMPARTELLEGVLSSDLIGFHTPDYQRHFQDSCLRILRTATADGDTVTYDGFKSKLGAFPIGIDPKRFIATIETDRVRQLMEKYKREFNGKKVFLGIDRLDYIKGIQHKIYALERLFEKHPKLAQEVVLVQIAVPSRTDVLEYQRLKNGTHKLVGRVNGLYGSVGSAPIMYLDRSIPFDEMCALYRVADAMVITSVRDGMNLVAYEYIACQRDMAGTLILSEFAGAAQSLDDNPIQVNPWSITSVADAMLLSLTMPEDERKRRSAAMFQHITTHTSSHWARQFLTAVLKTTNTPLNWLKDLSGGEPDTVASSTEAPTTNEDWHTAKAAAAVAPFEREKSRISAQ